MNTQLLYGAIIAWVFFWVGLYMGWRVSAWFYRGGR